MGEGGGCSWGAAPATRNYCQIERGSKLSLQELPLPDREREEAASGGAPAARGCVIERGRRLGSFPIEQ